MDYVKLNERNRDRIRRRLEVEVNKLGKIIEIKRIVYKPDGMNGYTEDSESSVYIGKAILLNNSGASKIIVDGGRKIEISGKLIIPYEKDLDIAANDFIIYEDRKYVVVDCVNIDNLNVYYEVMLTGNLERENGHG